MVRKYSLATDGEKQLSSSFKVKEFRCKDGSDEILISDELVHILQTIRHYYNAPITINSGYRTPEYNEKIGGAKDSQHMKGTAADINVAGIRPSKLYVSLDKGVVTGKSHPGGLGLYDNFVHVDVRKTKARWRG
jgi:uncharacterized protein YcbK (DUF882 family)